LSFKSLSTGYVLARKQRSQIYY